MTFMPGAMGECMNATQSVPTDRDSKAGLPSHYYKIKQSCAEVCWMGAQGQCRETGRPAGATVRNKGENKVTICSLEQRNHQVWLAMSDCLPTY